MRRSVFALCIGLLPGFLSTPLAAQPGCFGAGQPLFHCRADGKTVDLCLQGDVVLYRFGPAGGAADLLLARSVRGVGMRPWAGIGRYLSEEVTLRNAAYSYTVHYSVDRLAEGAPQAEGRVVVRQGEHVLADLTCAAGSLSAHDFYPVFEAKEAAGQCWSRADAAWGAC